MPTKIEEEEEEDQTRTERPVKVKELDIDFREPGLSHAVVKEAEHFRVQELVKKIENHPRRIESNDSSKWQCRVIRVMRNNSESAML